MNLINWKNACGMKNSENHSYKVKNNHGKNLWHRSEQQFISYEEFHVCFISEALHKYTEGVSLTAVFKFDSGWVTTVQ